MPGRLTALSIAPQIRAYVLRQTRAHHVAEDQRVKIPGTSFMTVPPSYYSSDKILPMMQNTTYIIHAGLPVKHKLQ